MIPSAAAPGWWAPLAGTSSSQKCGVHPARPWVDERRGRALDRLPGEESHLEDGDRCVIDPATEALTAEHCFDFAFIEGVCRESSTVPLGHVRPWARGPWHGLNGDIPSAASMLIPQVERMLRVRLKTDGVYTLQIGDGGVETEKGLGTLRDTEEATAFLGPSLAFELRAQLIEHSCVAATP